MDQISDDFISYTDSLLLKQEKPTDSVTSLNAPFCVASGPVSTFTTSVPSILQKFLNADDITETDSSRKTSCSITKRPRPFIIIKTKKEEPIESMCLKIEDDERLLSKSKRILKRVKAKQRNQLKQECAALLSPTSSKCTFDGSNELSVDGKTNKKMIQMIRNRISAQTSRDRKKNYLYSLERAKAKMSEDYNRLASENTQLMSELKRLKESKSQALQESEKLTGGPDFNGNLCQNASTSSVVEEPKALSRNSFVEISNSIQAPDGKKDLLNKAFTYATCISLLLLTKSDNHRNLNTQDLEELEDAKKMACKALERLISGQLQKGEDSPIVAILNDLCMRQRESFAYNRSVSSGCQTRDNPHSFLQSPNTIKVEEYEANRMAEPYFSLFNQTFGSRDSGQIDQDCPSEDPTLTSLSPKGFKYFEDDDLKGSHLHNNFDEGSFRVEQGVEKNDFNFFDAKPSFLECCNNGSYEVHKSV